MFPSFLLYCDLSVIKITKACVYVSHFNLFLVNQHLTLWFILIDLKLIKTLRAWQHLLYYMPHCYFKQACVHFIEQKHCPPRPSLSPNLTHTQKGSFWIHLRCWIHLTLWMGGQMPTHSCHAGQLWWDAGDTERHRCKVSLHREAWPSHLWPPDFSRGRVINMKIDPTRVKDQ